MESYLREIHPNGSLTAQQENDLMERYKESGDVVAFEKLIKANLKFVVSVAKAYQNKNTPLSDLISEGNIGLIKALEKYDPSRGFKFFSYAVWWIRQSIMQYLNDTQRMVRLPNNKSQDHGKIKKFIDLYYKKNGIIPTSDVICESIGLNETSYNQIMKFSTDFKSLSQNIDNGGGDGNDFCLEEMVESNFFDSPDRQTNLKDLKSSINSILSKLKEIEADILRADFEFLDDLGNIQITRDQISEKYRLTETRINQIRQVALIKLRSRFGIKKLQVLFA
jgi:RNA polymerase primary sigma factor